MSDLEEAIKAYKDYIFENTVSGEIIMDIKKVNDIKFLIDNFNLSTEQYLKEVEIRNNLDENILFNGNLDSVYKIIMKFVKDECIESDFSMLTEEQVTSNVKNWWNNNKFKFKK